MKKRKNNNEAGLVFLGYILAALIIIALGVGYAYWIGGSDLPDWVKFWLLK